MKRISVVFYFILCFLLLSILAGCTDTSDQLQNVLDDYTKVVAGDLPEDLRLTIYYISPSILTRVPVSAEALMDFPGVKTILVKFGELAAHSELLRKLEPSILQPVEEGSYIDARLYYVFEVGESEKILEVVISKIYGTVFVNGIEVENNAVFYELILPFLTEQDRSILGI